MFSIAKKLILENYPSFNIRIKSIFNKIMDILVILIPHSGDTDPP